MESNHVMQPKESMFFNMTTFTDLTPAEKHYSSASLVRMRLATRIRGKDLEETENALIAEGRFVLKVTDVVFTESTEKAQPMAAPTAPNSEGTPQNSTPNISLPLTQPPSSNQSPQQNPSPNSPLPLAQPTSTAASDIGRAATIVGVPIGDQLNVRSAPAMNSKLSFTLSNGTEVQVRSDSVFNRDTEWIPITVGARQGWVRSKYLQLESKQP